jgi:hypothetical protein
MAIVAISSNIMMIVFRSRISLCTVSFTSINVMKRFSYEWVMRCTEVCQGDVMLTIDY